MCAIKSLNGFFDKIVVSEDVGVLKPNKKIFQFALDKCGAKIEECLMIGDDLISDIYGARKFGMDQVFFNYKFLNTKVQATYKISYLKEIEGILL